jgi:chromosome segregation ATPase
MDSLRSKVTTIESSLQDSRRSLQRCENQARSGIGIEVVAMRQALLQGDQRISRVTSEVQSFMKLIEDLEPSEVDLKPQVNWLSESIATILRDFETAESQANKAMQQTMNYQYSVNDIGQDIAVRQHDLIEAHKNGVELAAIAEAQLRQSEKLVIWAEDNMNQKTREINNKTTEAVNLRSQLYDYQGALRDREGDLAQAKRKAESKKGKALLGVVSDCPVPYISQELTAVREPEF